jgi:hypothetical protein
LSVQRDLTSWQQGGDMTMACLTGKGHGKNTLYNINLIGVKAIHQHGVELFWLQLLFSGDRKNPV